MLQNGRIQLIEACKRESFVYHLYIIYIINITSQLYNSKMFHSVSGFVDTDTRMSRRFSAIRSDFHSLKYWLRLVFSPMVSFSFFQFGFTVGNGHKLFRVVSSPKSLFRIICCSLKLFVVPGCFSLYCVFFFLKNIQPSFILLMGMFSLFKRNWVEVFPMR